MRFKFVCILTLGGFFILLSNAFADDNVKTKRKYGAELSAIGQIKATIVAPVSASSSNDLRFGMIVKNNAGDVTVDEEKGVEKRTANFMYVQAKNIKDALAGLTEGMSHSLVDYEIVALNETALMDVFPYEAVSVERTPAPTIE